ncbi:MAG: hypothetical protein M3R10_03110 [Verrucomicrobiota bacterium]|nr:hypothetical protein [Verrucomicrobiota bacterium]
MRANNGGTGNVSALARRKFLLRWGRRFCFCLALAALSFAALRCYESWRQDHLTAQLQAFVRQNDFRSAVLVARRLLALDQNNLVASFAMAEMAEKAGDTDAVSWRKKIAQLAPNEPANQIALARTALRFNQPDLAGLVLNALPASAQQSVEFHQVAGAEALVRQQLAVAEEHFAAAVQLAPDNPHIALNLATLRLASRDTKIAAQARNTLAGLTNQSATRPEALRALTTDALARHENAAAQKWSAQLNAETGATFADTILAFQSAEGTEAAAPLFAALRKKAATSAGNAAEFITWLNRHELARVALLWSATLPKEISGTNPVPLAIAEAHSFLGEWSELRAQVDGKNWGDFEPLRFAVLSHAFHRLSPPDRPSIEAQTAWNAALKTAQVHPEQLIALAQLADGWGYQNEAEQAWWTVADSNQNNRLALSALQRFYKTKQDTRGLLRVAQRAFQLNPNDLVAANNCASLGLLLSGDSTSRRLAGKLHNEHPTSRAFAATYAFALHTEGKSAEGLRLLENMSEQELRQPALAAYYVVLLVANKELERARSFLIDAQRASLLPEEKQLFAGATEKILAHENAISQR